MLPISKLLDNNVKQNEIVYYEKYLDIFFHKPRAEDFRQCASEEYGMEIGSLGCGDDFVVSRRFSSDKLFSCIKEVTKKGI